MTFTNTQVAITSKALRQETQKIFKYQTSTLKSLMNIATTIKKIYDNELYKEDFKNIYEYGEKVFGYKKSSINNMINIVDRFMLEDGTCKYDGEDKAFGFTQLAEILPIKTNEEVDEMVDNNEINPYMSVKQIREAVKKHNKGEPEEKTTEPEATEPETKTDEPIETTFTNIKVFEGVLNPTLAQFIEYINQFDPETEISITIRH